MRSRALACTSCSLIGLPGVPRTCRVWCETGAPPGRKTVTIRDGDGGEIHAGPLDGPDDFEAVPEDWQDRVRALDDRAAGGPGRPRPLPGGV